jgi:hypothetical protein
MFARFFGLVENTKPLTVDASYQGFNKVLSPDVVETEDSRKHLEVHHIGLLSKQQRWRKKWVERLFEVKNGCLSYKYPMTHPKHETKEHTGEYARFCLHLP